MLCIKSMFSVSLANSRPEWTTEIMSANGEISLAGSVDDYNAMLVHSVVDRQFIFQPDDWSREVVSVLRASCTKTVYNARAAQRSVMYLSHLLIPRMF